MRSTACQTRAAHSHPMNVRDHMCLTIATTHYPHAGQRINDMHEQVGLTETRFWARVNRLLDNPDAEATRPQIVHRLKRIREQRAAARKSRG